jgi:hypothetical protein
LKEKVAMVREEINSAYAGLEPPDLTRVLNTAPAAEEDGGVDELYFFRELEGKRWDELRADYLEKRWHHFSSLSAETYRYYLPALLTAALDGIERQDTDPLLHSTTFSLGPAYWKLYHYGEDKHFQYQTSLFSEAQYRAVCSFLGLVAELFPGYWFLTAGALRWGWNKYDHPALEESRALAKSWHNFRYPPAEDPAVAKLLEQIDEAFAETPYPGDADICHPRKGDDEVAEYALEFRGARWQSLNPVFLSSHYAALSFFTPRAFRYFLPAYLFAELMAPQLDVPSNANPAWALSHGFSKQDADLAQTLSIDTTKWVEALREQFPAMDVPDDFFEPVAQPEIDWEARSRQRFAGFNRRERQAIVAYLRYTLTNDEYSAATIEAALEKYWLPSLAEE